MVKVTKDKFDKDEIDEPILAGMIEEDSNRKRQSRRKVYERVSGTKIPKYVSNSFKKDGYELRLVRWAIHNEPDYRYLARREAEGYEFVKADEMPKEFLRSLRVQDTQVTKGLLTNGGDLCFMKIDTELRESRRQFYNGEAQAQIDAVDINVFTQNGLKNTGTRSKTLMREPVFQD